jgi:seryl-tRNA synthetase
MYKARIQVVFTRELGSEARVVVHALAERIGKGTVTGEEFMLDRLNATVTGPETATDYLVQLDKRLRAELGRGFKTGVKEFHIVEYEVTENLDELPAKEFAAVPFAKEVFFDNDAKTVTLRYERIPLEYVKEHYVERTLKLIKDKIRMANYEGKDEFKEYIWEGKERPVVYTGDPAVDLEKMGRIRRTEAKGQFVYGREYAAFASIIRDLFQEHVFAKLGFHEMIFPKFEPWAIPKASGHAKNIYPNAYFVSVPKNAAPEYWEEVMDLYAITGEVPAEKVVERSQCVGILSYAQCPPFWTYLENRIVEEETLPLLTYDWSGPTYRNESGGTHGLDRIEEFHRTEILFVGTKAQVVETWAKLKDALITLFDKVLDMEIKVAKVTPWWMAHAGLRAASENPDIGTYDFDAYLPYRGDRDKEWLEIQNDSCNGDKYPKAFHVKGRKGEYLWSGCAGNSMQRIVAAFLAQKGLDPANWPAAVRERYEQKTKGVVALRFC